MRFIDDEFKDTGSLLPVRCVRLPPGSRTKLLRGALPHQGTTGKAEACLHLMLRERSSFTRHRKYTSGKFHHAGFSGFLVEASAGVAQHHLDPRIRARRQAQSQDAFPSRNRREAAEAAKS